MTTAQAVLEADSRVNILDETDKSALRVALDTSLEGSGALDVYTAAAAVDVATRLDYRVADARGIFRLVAQRDALAGCSGSEGLYQVGVAAAIGAELPGYPQQRVDALWGPELAKLKAQLDGVTSEPGLGESQALLALCRIASARGYPADVLAELGTELDQLASALASGRASDITAMSADSDAAARLLSRDNKPSDAQLAHLRLVVAGGGDASTTALDARSIALVLRAARAVGRVLPLPSGWPQDPDATARLELLLATVGSTEHKPVALAVADAIRVPGQQGAMAVVRALAVLGSSACAVPGAIDFSRSLVAAASAPDGEPAIGSLAVRFLQRCGSTTEEMKGIQNTILDAQRRVIDLISRDEAHRPTLLEAWQAVATLCALDPGSLPPVEELWRHYSSEAMSFGGAKAMTTPYVDISATFALATITGWTRDRCVDLGTIG